jgi:hypothetical protein
MGKLSSLLLPNYLRINISVGQLFSFFAIASFDSGIVVISVSAYDGEWWTFLAAIVCCQWHCSASIFSSPKVHPLAVRCACWCRPSG